MNDKDFVLDTLRRAGLAVAQSVQEQAADMTGTALNAQADHIPDFQAAKAKANMSTRKAGEKDGFICRSTAGRVVRLIQTYDSDTYPAEPEELPAQWRFVWSTDPQKALPFIEMATSPYAATAAPMRGTSGAADRTPTPGRLVRSACSGKTSARSRRSKVRNDLRD